MCGGTCYRQQPDKVVQWAETPDDVLDLIDKMKT